MATVHFSQATIELARCANLEILTAVPLLFQRFEQPPAAPVIRALEVYQTGLELLSAELEAETLYEMIRAHEDISQALQVAARAADLPPELIEQFAIAFREFGSGLRAAAPL